MAVLCAAGLAGLLQACGGTSVVPVTPVTPDVTPAAPLSAPTPVPPASSLLVQNNVLVGAGDIDDCGPGAEQTAALLDGIAGTVFTAGDNAYNTGTLQEYMTCYDKRWGRHKLRTRPAPGNHEYESGGSGYFAYYGDAAGPPGVGYYSYEVGEWLILSLNSSAGVGQNSEQMRWLRQTLGVTRHRCIGAYWHEPFVSSGASRCTGRMRYIWALLQQYGADWVVAGHDHFYERFAPVDERGVASATGIRSFVAGTGGAALQSAAAINPASQFRARIWGVLKLTLDPGSYDWQFVSVSPGFGDRGHQSCD